MGVGRLTRRAAPYQMDRHSRLPISRELHCTIFDIDLDLQYESKSYPNPGASLMISPRHLRCSSVALFALLLTAVVAPTASAAPSHRLPIAAARHRPLGSTVTVRGTV